MAAAITTGCQVMAKRGGGQGIYIPLWLRLRMTMSCILYLHMITELYMRIEILLISAKQEHNRTILAQESFITIRL